MNIDNLKAFFILNGFLYSNAAYAQESDKLTGFQQYLVDQGITNPTIISVANFVGVLGVLGASFAVLWIMSFLGGKTKSSAQLTKKETPKWLGRIGMFIGYSLFPLFLGTGFMLGVAKNFSELNRNMPVIKEVVSTGFQFIFFFGGVAMVIFGLRSGARIIKGKEPF